MTVIVKLLWLSCFWSVLLPLSAETRIPVGEFSSNHLHGWEHKRFKGETRYQLQLSEGSTVLKAGSQASGSGLFKEQRIDLTQTPFLHWSWRIANRLQGLNEQSKACDDYAARVYVVVKGGLAFLADQSYQLCLGW